MANRDDVATDDVGAREEPVTAGRASASNGGTRRKRPPRNLPFVRDEEIFTEDDALQHTLKWVEELDGLAKQERDRWDEERKRWAEKERELPLPERREPPAPFDKPRAERLVRRLHRLGVRRKEAYVLTNVLFLFAWLLMLAIAPVWAAAAWGSDVDGWQPAAVVGSTAAILLVAALVCRQRYWEIGDQQLQLENEFDRLKLPVQDESRRALKLFQNHSLELRRYYGQALRHGAFIFWIGIVCIAAGFGVVAAALAILAGDIEGTTENITIAVLGITSGVLANFVGAIYIRMYSQTVSSLGAFHTRLVTTHHLHFANYVAAKITDPPTREEALAQMALSLTQATAAPAPMNATPAGSVVVTPMAPASVPNSTPPNVAGTPAQNTQEPAAARSGRWSRGRRERSR